MDNCSEELTCTVCTELFGPDEKCPRILSCGHSFCHSCIEKVIRQNRFCPICRKEIASPFSESLPINYIVKRLAENFLKEGKNKIQKVSKDYCQEHSSKIYFECSDCSKFVCGTCIQFFHKQCKNIISIQEALEQKKKNQLLKIFAAKKGIITEEKEIQKALQCLQKKCVAFNHPWLKNESANYFKETLTAGLNNLTELEDTLQNAKNSQDLDNAVDKIQQCLNALNFDSTVS